jgi:hypothetical protein
MGDGHAIADHYSAVGFYCTGGDIAQTGIGVLDVWLKARESADAPNDKKVTLYTKSKALVIGIDAYDARGRNSRMASETQRRRRRRCWRSCGHNDLDGLHVERTSGD